MKNMCASFRRTALSALVLLCMLPDAFGWGGIGHQVVVEIAQRHIAARTKENIRKYMPYDMKKDASWADKHRKGEWAFTNSWHAFYADSLTHRYDPDAPWRSGRNIDLVAALRAIDINLSRYRHLSDSAVLFNLRELIHLVGDLHCPVHVIYGSPDGQRGKCRYEGKVWSSFHAFYDSFPFRMFPGVKKADQMADMLDTWSSKEIRAAQKGTPRSWAEECSQKCAVIYGWNWPRRAGASSKVIVDLRPDTVELSRPLCTEQLQLAGYRLAGLLDKYFCR